MVTPRDVNAAFATVDGVTFRQAADGDRDFERTLLASMPTGNDMDHLPADARDRLVQIQFEAQHASNIGQYPDSTRWIISRAGRGVGRVWIDCSAERLHVIDLVIAHHARGEGIASRTLTALLDLGDGFDVPLSLRVAAGNSDARRLYVRLGFVVAFETETEAFMERLPK